MQAFTASPEVLEEFRRLAAEHLGMPRLKNPLNTISRLLARAQRSGRDVRIVRPLRFLVGPDGVVREVGTISHQQPVAAGRTGGLPLSRQPFPDSPEAIAVSERLCNRSFMARRTDAGRPVLTESDLRRLCFEAKPLTPDMRVGPRYLFHVEGAQMHNVRTRPTIRQPLLDLCGERHGWDARETFEEVCRTILFGKTVSPEDSCYRLVPPGCLGLRRGDLLLILTRDRDAFDVIPIP